MNNWRNKKIIITGAKFIGIHLINKLISLNPSSITVVNLTNKHFARLEKNKKDIKCIAADLRNLETAQKLLKGCDIVIHLAADHGGRGYVSLRQGNTASNFLLDGSVFRACLNNNIEKVFYASSGCVYPNHLQVDTTKKSLLKESQVKTPYDADNIYGWAKLMGELTLKQYYKDFGLKSAIGRFFTVYGPFASENHAVVGTIAKAFIHQDPFEIWGNGKQVRNWTYVDDIVDGIIASIENIDDATPINLGTEERITVNQMVKMTLGKMKFNPEKITHVDMPTGPVNRVASNKLANKLLNWSPKTNFEDGLSKTIEWYTKNHKVSEIKKNLEKKLIDG